MQKSGGIHVVMTDENSRRYQTVFGSRQKRGTGSSIIIARPRGLIKTHASVSTISLLLLAPRSMRRLDDSMCRAVTRNNLAWLERVPSVRRCLRTSYAAVSTPMAYLPVRERCQSLPRRQVSKSWVAEYMVIFSLEMMGRGGVKFTNWHSLPAESRPLNLKMDLLRFLEPGMKQSLSIRIAFGEIVLCLVIYGARQQLFNAPFRCWKQHNRPSNVKDLIRLGVRRLTYP